MAKKREKALYILHVRMTKGEPYIWDPRFAFHAYDDGEARQAANRWASYHGKIPNDVAVKKVGKGEALPYSEGFVHDDWIPDASPRRRGK